MQTAAKIYSDGIRDGMEIVIDLVLNNHSTMNGGGVPYQGEVPDELKKYLNAAKSKIEQDRRIKNADR